MGGTTQDGVRADETHPLLPQRRPGAEPPAEGAGPAGPADPAGTQGADPPRTVPDLNVLRQVLAGLRRLD